MNNTDKMCCYVCGETNIIQGTAANCCLSCFRSFCLFVHATDVKRARHRQKNEDAFMVYGYATILQATDE